MEVLLKNFDSDFPEASYLSVRAGSTVKRQAPHELGKPLKLPWEALRRADGSLVSEVTVEALSVLGKGTLFLKQGAEKCGLNFESICENRKTNWNVEVRWSQDEKALLTKPQTSRPPTQPVERQSKTAEKRPASVGRTASRHTHAISAQKYLNKHKMLQAMHDVLQAAVKERPEDPLAFMGRMLLKMSDEPKDVNDVDTVEKPASRKDTEGKGDKIVSHPAFDATPPSKPYSNLAESQPAPEPSPAECRKILSRSGSSSGRIELPPLEPRGERCIEGMEPPPPLRLSTASTIVASVGDIEGENEAETSAQGAASRLVEESFCKSSQKDQSLLSFKSQPQEQSSDAAEAEPSKPAEEKKAESFTTCSSTRDESVSIEVLSAYLREHPDTCMFTGCVAKAAIENCEQLGIEPIVAMFKEFAVSVRPGCCPSILGQFVDLEAPEALCHQLLQAVGSKCPLQPLVEQADRRGVLCRMLPWFEQRRAERLEEQASSSKGAAPEELRLRFQQRLVDAASNGDLESAVSKLAAHSFDADALRQQAKRALIDAASNDKLDQAVANLTKSRDSAVAEQKQTASPTERETADEDRLLLQVLAYIYGTTGRLEQMADIGEKLDIPTLQKVSKRFAKEQSTSAVEKLAAILDPPPLTASPTSVGGATLDQDLEDEADYQSGAAAKDVAKDAADQIFKEELQQESRKAVSDIKGRLMAKLAAKLKDDKLDDIVRHVFVVNSGSPQGQWLSSTDTSTGSTSASMPTLE